VQAARLESLEQFRKGEVSFLLATDVAARGLDILGVQTVINYDCPTTLEPYLHRIGRTARAGEAGLAITFVEDGDRGLLKLIVKKVKASLTNRVVPAATVAGWRARTERLYPQVQDVIDVRTCCCACSCWCLVFAGPFAGYTCDAVTDRVSSGNVRSDCHTMIAEHAAYACRQCSSVANALVRGSAAAGPLIVLCEWH
jgi:hypothetical protein